MSACEATNRWNAASDFTSVSARSDSVMRFWSRGRARRRAAFGMGRDDEEEDAWPVTDELELTDVWRRTEPEERRLL